MTDENEIIAENENENDDEEKEESAEKIISELQEKIDNLEKDNKEYKRKFFDGNSILGT